MDPYDLSRTMKFAPKSRACFTLQFGSVQRGTYHSPGTLVESHRLPFPRFRVKSPCYLRVTRFDARLELRGEFRQFPERDSLSNLAHNVKEKCNVVMGVQDGGQDFVGVKQVAQVGARVGFANHAGASLIERAGIVGINRVADVHPA